MHQKSGEETHRRVRALVSIAIVALAIGGTAALAGHLGGTSYTGCLALNGGTLTSIAEGNSPQKPCGPGTVVAHIGSGDITAVLAGAGLTGGGSDGSVTLSVAPTYQLPQTCTMGQVAKWTGSGWSCAADSDSQYVAGTGLQLVGSEFSIAPDHRVTNNQACGGGLFATGIDNSGVITCGAPAGVKVFANQLLLDAIIPIPEEGEAQILTLNVPAGVYSIVVIGETEGPNDADYAVKCSLYDGTTRLSFGSAYTDEGSVSLAMMARSPFAAPAQLRVVCAADEEGVQARVFGIQALKFD